MDIKLNDLKYTKGSRKKKTRVGRGHAAGKGKQAGRGQSGQTKRGTTRPGFEGGQNPWYRRLPKRGFKNINYVKYQIISLDQLEKKFKNNETVNKEKLKKLGLVKNDLPVKILANGKLKKTLKIKVDAISAAAKKIVEQLGGKIEEV